jgi:sister-chromatid-cohesion protein PDS5
VSLSLSPTFLFNNDPERASRGHSLSQKAYLHSMVKATAVVATSTAAWAKVLQKGQSTDSLLRKLKVRSSFRQRQNDLPTDTPFTDCKYPQELQKVLAKPDVKDLNDATIEVIKSQLIQEQLLFHKSIDVRSSLACCIADLLRLCAPDSPFNGGELQTIFQFFLAVLTKSSGGLSKPNGPLFTDACTLLDNLTNTKSILLICDLDSAETLITEYVSRFLSIIK